MPSSDGQYVYATSNSNFDTVGHFNAFDIETIDTPILPVYSNLNVSSPFGALGYYHNPSEGYYNGGQDACQGKFAAANVVTTVSYLAV